MSYPENTWGTLPSYTCPVCGTPDAERIIQDHTTVCDVCGAIDGEPVQ